MTAPRILGLVVAAFALLVVPAAAQLTATTTTVTATISVTSTFQQALARNASRKGCLLQNNGTHVMYVYFGTLANATTSNSFQINPGQTISCATPGGVVLGDAVNITGTGTETYVVTSQ